MKDTKHAHCQEMARDDRDGMMANQATYQISYLYDTPINFVILRQRI